MNVSKSLLSVSLSVMAFFPCLAQRTSVDLSGSWALTLDDGTVKESVMLPGTLDTNGVGDVNNNYQETTQLSRKVTYTGNATFSKSITIPKNWKNKNINLYLERTRPSTVYVDGKKVGSRKLLSAPHVYNLSEYMVPGEHELTIVVNNGDSIPTEIKNSSHAATESTQTNWNGIIGKIELQVKPKSHISGVNVFPDFTNSTMTAVVDLSTDKDLIGKSLNINIAGQKASAKIKKGETTYRIDLPLPKDVRVWSERDPYRHDLSAFIPGVDTLNVKVGIRDFAEKNHRFYVNDTLTFLRGKHDGCVFPLTGFPPMDVESWRDYFQTIKEYGLNHVRFHSWCPPEACFEAADIEGVYLQPELPIWGSFDENNESLMSFLLEDGDAIHSLYSRHPSFVMFALGNELWGEVPVMKRFVDHFRSYENRHLYTYGTNGYLGYQGCIPGQDFFVTCRVGGGDNYSTDVRASFSFADEEEGGILNNTYPSTERNFESAVMKSPKPVVGHETGQFQIYPDYKEMAKYTGVLEPRNFEIFRQRLDSANMLGQAHDFFLASGKWSAELYKADMEMNFRTPHIAGFQLLDLQDYPGQGTALVGVLDAFMESKGLITPERWRESCNDIVLLGEFPSFTWSDGDTFSSELVLANYSGKSLSGKVLDAELIADGNSLISTSHILKDGEGLINIGLVSAVLPDLGKAYTAELKLKLDNGKSIITNSYPLWVYPSDRSFKIAEDIMIVDGLSAELEEHLTNGGKAMLIPKKESVDSTTVGGLFQTDYWNYRMFKTISQNNGKKVSPGTLGILTDPEHPALSQFPTEFHSNWQWYPIVKNSYPLILDRLNDINYRPIVQVVDNVERNHRLGIVNEFKVGNGSLLILMCDSEALKGFPEGEQFMKSIVDYVSSDNFNPSTELSFDDLRTLLYEPLHNKGIKFLHNISYD